MFLLYDLIWVLLFPLVLPCHLLMAYLRGKPRRGLRERFGFYPPEVLKLLQGKKVLWVHAVSVGETRAAVPLLKVLKEHYPEHLLVLSHVTETGRNIAQGIQEVDLCLFFPYDISWVVKRVLRQLRPSLIAIVETEIWPNLVHRAEAAGVPVVLVNGRISDRSFPRYRLLRHWLRPVLDCFSSFCMQSEQDAVRIRALGASAERVQVTGNLKFDMNIDSSTVTDSQQLRHALRLPTAGSVLVAGSTHEGEERLIAEVFGRLRHAGFELSLVMAPRHPERCTAVAEVLSSCGLEVRLASGISTQSPPLTTGEVLLVDSVGQLLKYYGAADLIVVGGSFVPVGGHNILEAALVGKPVLFGPYMANFKDIARKVLEGGAGVQVTQGEELFRALCRLLEQPRNGLAMGECGKALLAQNKGATALTLTHIEKTLASCP